MMSTNKALSGLLALCLATGSVGAPTAAQTLSPASPTRGPLAPATVQDGFSLAAGGDLLGAFQAQSVRDPTRAVWRLFQQADAGFANLEGNLFDEATFDGYPASENGSSLEYGGVSGGPVHAVTTARGLREVGINLVSLANNHGFDWGARGLEATIRNLNEAGLIHAGGGRNLAYARAPGILETARGRVALIATTATYLPEAIAGPGDGLAAPRPGLSVVRITPVTLVNETEFAALRSIAERQGQTIGADAREILLRPTVSPFTLSRYRLSDTPGLTLELNQEDLDGILASIRDAKRNVDTVMLSVHAHDSESGASDAVQPVEAGAQPPESLRQFYHQAVDAGADAVLVHGPHVLRGIEIYRDRPIFYGLGSLIYGLGLTFRGYQLPREWDDSIVAVSEFRNGGIVEIRLYPIIHAQNVSGRSDEDLPKIASPADGQRILDFLQRVSARFGTNIEIRDNVGIIRIAGR